MERTCHPALEAKKAKAIKLSRYVWRYNCPRRRKTNWSRPECQLSVALAPYECWHPISDWRLAVRLVGEGVNAHVTWLAGKFLPFPLTHTIARNTVWLDLPSSQSLALCLFKNPEPWIRLVVQWKALFLLYRSPYMTLMQYNFLVYFSSRVIGDFGTMDL